MARNRGIEAATGKYITFIDADDWVEPDYLSVIVNTRPECDLLFFGNKHRLADGMAHSYSPGDKYAEEQIFREELLLLMSQNSLWFEFFGYTWNKRFKNSIIKKHHIRFQPNLALREDELFTEEYCRQISDVACTSHCIYNYRFSYSGLTYRYHPGSEVLLLALCLNQVTDNIMHPRLQAYKKSKVFHYLFTATLDIPTKESLKIFDKLFSLYKTHHEILTNDSNPFLDKRTGERYKRIFTKPRAISRIWYMVKRKMMKKSYNAV